MAEEDENVRSWTNFIIGIHLLISPSVDYLQYEEQPRKYKGIIEKLA